MEKIVDKMAYAEIYEVLELLGDDYINKLPKKFYEYIVEQKPLQYNTSEVRKKVANVELSQEALNILAIINTKYFTESELVKKAYRDIFESNDKKNNDNKNTRDELQNIKKDVFKDRKNNRNIEIEEKNEIIEYEETNIFKKLINKIKTVLKMK